MRMDPPMVRRARHLDISFSWMASWSPRQKAFFPQAMRALLKTASSTVPKIIPWWSLMIFAGAPRGFLFSKNPTRPVPILPGRLNILQCQINQQASLCQTWPGFRCGKRAHLYGIRRPALRLPVRRLHRSKTGVHRRLTQFPKHLIGRVPTLHRRCSIHDPEGIAEGSQGSKTPGKRIHPAPLSRAHAGGMPAPLFPRLIRLSPNGVLQTPRLHGATLPPVPPGMCGRDDAPPGH